jgi:hypothetical protein
MTAFFRIAGVVTPDFWLLIPLERCKFCSPVKVAALRGRRVAAKVQPSIKEIINVHRNTGAQTLTARLLCASDSGGRGHSASPGALVLPSNCSGDADQSAPWRPFPFIFFSLRTSPERHTRLCLMHNMPQMPDLARNYTKLTECT